MDTKKTSSIVVLLAFCMSLVPVEASAGILFGFGGFGFRGGRGGFGGSPQSHRYGTGIRGGHYLLTRSEMAYWRLSEARREHNIRFAAWQAGDYARAYGQRRSHLSGVGYGAYGSGIGGVTLMQAPVVRSLSGVRPIAQRTNLSQNFPATGIQNQNMTSMPNRDLTATQEPRYQLSSNGGQDLELRRMLAQTYGSSATATKSSSNAAAKQAEPTYQEAPAPSPVPGERSIWGAVKRGLFGR